MKLTSQKLIELGFEEEVQVTHVWYSKTLNDRYSMYIKVQILKDTVDFKNNITIEVKDFIKLHLFSGNPTTYSIFRGNIKSTSQFKILLKCTTPNISNGK